MSTWDNLNEIYNYASTLSEYQHVSFLEPQIGEIIKMSSDTQKVSEENGFFNLTIDFGYHVKLHGSPDVFLNKIKNIRIIKKEVSIGELTEHECLTKYHGRFTTED